MHRQVLALVCLLFGSQATLMAANFEDLFDSLAHDFGTVARGPTVVHSFRLTNTTTDPIRIATLRVPCSCVTATIEKKELAPGDSTTIIAQMHTGRFHGVWKKPIFVQFDRPSWAEVQLTVQATSLDDITTSAPAFDFGRITQGSSAKQNIQLKLIGQSKSQLVTARCDSNYVQVEFRRIEANSNLFHYEVTAQLRPDLPGGNWFSSIILETDRPDIRVNVPLTVQVLPSLRVIPEVVLIGDIPRGKILERRIMVRSDRPFRIVAIQGLDESLRIEHQAQSRNSSHVLEMHISANAPGSMMRRIQIQTDLPEANQVEFQIQGNVLP